MKLIIGVLLLSTLVPSQCINSGDEDEQEKPKEPFTGEDLKEKFQHLGLAEKGQKISNKGEQSSETQPSHPEEPLGDTSPGQSGQGAEGGHPPPPGPDPPPYSEGATGYTPYPLPTEDPPPYSEIPSGPPLYPPAPPRYHPQTFSQMAGQSGNLPLEPTEPELITIALDTKRKEKAENSLFEVVTYENGTMCHVFTPKRGFIYNEIFHNGLRVWTSSGGNHAKRVTICNIGYADKVMHIEPSSGYLVTMKKTKDGWKRKK